MGKDVKKRLLYFDNLKGFAILLVVLGHCIQQCDTEGNYQFLYRLIYAFHMPLFMAVSGYFGVKLNVELVPDLKKKFVRLMIPYLAWGGVSLIIHKASLIQLVVDPDKYLWFLWDLFFISLLVNVVVLLISKITLKRDYIFKALFLLAMTILCLGKFLAENDFNVKSICWMFQFYVAGAAFKEYGEKLKNIKVLGPVTAATFVLAVWAQYSFVTQESLMTYVVMMALAYIGCLACFLLFKSYSNAESVIAELGQSTLGVYAIHQSLITLLGINNVWYSFVVVLTISIIIIYLIRSSIYLKFLIGE